MIVSGALGFQMPWVAALLVLELLLDAATVGTSARWWLSCSEKNATVPLRLAAAAIVLHAVRVAVFTLGRVGPWHEFDIRPEYRLQLVASSTLGQVYLASMLSIAGVLGVVVIWYRRRYARKHGS